MMRKVKDQQNTLAHRNHTKRIKCSKIFSFEGFIVVFSEHCINKAARSDRKCEIFFFFIMLEVTWSLFSKESTPTSETFRFFSESFSSIIDRSFDTIVFAASSSSDHTEFHSSSSNFLEEGLEFNSLRSF